MINYFSSKRYIYFNKKVNTNEPDKYFYSMSKSGNAEKIVEMADLIRQKDAETEVSLICTGNICSKSIQLLENNNIGVLIDEEE